MKIHLRQLTLVTRRSIEVLPFADRVTFIYGPVGKGKSTTARLVDYCFGGDLERTPALQQEFVSATLSARLGDFEVEFERSATDASYVRVTWGGSDGRKGSVNAPLAAGPNPLVETAYNLSDLIFWLCGIRPMRVRRSKSNPDSELVRLSFRDLLWYCYLEQLHLDSSFFRMDDAFKRLKSRDAMRFVTGLHSERLAEIDDLLARTMEEQRTKRETVQQLRNFIARFNLGTAADISEALTQSEASLRGALAHRVELDRRKAADTHPVEPLRAQLRMLSEEIDTASTALRDLREEVEHQKALRSELITSKLKAARVAEAARVLEGVSFERCPQCGADIAKRSDDEAHCRLCGELDSAAPAHSNHDVEALRLDLNERIDELEISLDRKSHEVSALERSLAATLARKAKGDGELARRLAEYDTAFVAAARDAERSVAQLEERIAALNRLKELPTAIAALEAEAGALQGQIDSLRSDLVDERGRLTAADRCARLIARKFHEIMLAVRFPDVYPEDRVVVDTRTWLPYVVHDTQEWGFYDAGSGGKKTLFNVCFALAVHSVAEQENLPLPTFLVIDSPTKNISEDMDPGIVTSLYQQIYRMATDAGHTQFILIDSDIVLPAAPIDGFAVRRMAGTPDAPCLIPYYAGP